MACMQSCNAQNGNLFDPNSLLFFFLALSALSNDGNNLCSGNTLLLFFLLLALLGNGETCGTGTC